MLTDFPSRKVNSVETAFRLVTVLQSLGRATLTELAEYTDLANSTVHNYLTTLESMGYVVNEDGKYRLGLRFLTHGIAAKRSLDTREIAFNALQTLASDVSHPTWWVNEELGRGVFLEHSLPEGQEKIYGRIGKRSYLHTHAPGKAILAELPRSEVEAIVDYHGLPGQTTKTTTDEDGLFGELETVRERGIAVSDGEAVLGVQSIGASFKSPSGRPNAIGLFGYSRDFAGKYMEEDISKRLKDVVTALENTLRGVDD
jgi:DNA-binding IclR family transcriptional regulator